MVNKHSLKDIGSYNKYIRYTYRFDEDIKAK